MLWPVLAENRPPRAVELRNRPARCIPRRAIPKTTRRSIWNTTTKDVRFQKLQTGIFGTLQPTMQGSKNYKPECSALKVLKFGSRVLWQSLHLVSERPSRCERPLETIFSIIDAIQTNIVKGHLVPFLALSAKDGMECPLYFCLWRYHLVLLSIASPPLVFVLAQSTWG